MKKYFQQEFSQVGIKGKEVKEEIENKAKVNKKKKAIEKRSHIKRNTCDDAKNEPTYDAERGMNKIKMQVAGAMEIALLAQRSHIKRNTCEDAKNVPTYDAERSMNKIKMINKARSLALQFMQANPNCIRAIPYESEDSQSLIMCLHMDTNGKRIPEEVKSAAKKLFENYEIEFVDLLQLPLNTIVTQPSSRKNSNKLDEISRKIENNLHLFENRMNVTAVQASYKVKDSIEQNTPCVRVYVVGKGRIPAGETDIKDIKKESGEIFDQTEFDIAEGYYKLSNGSSLEGYTRPLQGGVEIGVEGVHGAGTLGGFLEDEDGNVYIVSNQHVLHPHDAKDKKVIVQPSELDYNDIHSKSEKKLKRLTTKINAIRATNNEESNSALKETQGDINEEKVRLDKIESGRPRLIGKYVCGVKNNHAFGDFHVYVDAAIAKLDEKELSAIKEHKKWEVEATRCPLYGFETEKHWEDNDYHPPNGEIIDFQSFQAHVRKERERQPHPQPQLQQPRRRKQRRKRQRQRQRQRQLSETPSELRFMKIGKSTGRTVEGCFNIPKERIHLNFIHSKDIPGLIDTPYFFCKKCIQLEYPNHRSNPETSERNYEMCRKCKKQLQNPGHIRSFWARNCFLVGKRRTPFSEEGDSGALVFDKQGRAWGLTIGCFDDSTSNLSTLISPLFAALDALKRKSKKKELKLWCIRNGNHHSCQQNMETFWVTSYRLQYFLLLFVIFIACLCARWIFER